MELHVITFGYGHGEPLPEAHITIDVRKLFKDPHGISEAMRTKTARDAEVVASVMRQPGARGFALDLALTALALGKPINGRVVLAIGCTGGKHRAPALGEARPAGPPDGRYGHRRAPAHRQRGHRPLRATRPRKGSGFALRRS